MGTLAQPLTAARSRLNNIWRWPFTVRTPLTRIWPHGTIERFRLAPANRRWITRGSRMRPVARRYSGFRRHGSHLAAQHYSRAKPIRPFDSGQIIPIAPTNEAYSRTHEALQVQTVIRTARLTGFEDDEETAHRTRSGDNRPGPRIANAIPPSTFERSHPLTSASELGARSSS